MKRNPAKHKLKAITAIDSGSALEVYSIRDLSTTIGKQEYPHMLVRNSSLDTMGNRPKRAY